MSTGCEFIDDDWPLVRVNYRRLMTDEEFDRYLALHDSVLARREPFVMLHIPGGDFGTVPRRHRYLLVDWLRRNESELRKYLAGSAFVVESVIHRMTISFVFSLSPPPGGYKVFTELSEAEAWCRERLSQRHRLLAGGASPVPTVDPVPPRVWKF